MGNIFELYENMVLDVISPQGYKLLQAGMGMCTESAEFLDQLKKHHFQGRPLDIPNLKEELGDIMWYVQLGCISLDISLPEVMEKNIQKLRARFPEGYTDEKANNRDLETERAILEEPASVNSRASRTFRTTPE